MNTDIYNPEAIRHAFKFLVDEFGYRVTTDIERCNEDRPYDFVIEYEGNDRRVRLVHDYKENFFYFQIIRGLETKFPNEADRENIRPFWQFFKKSYPALDLNSTQPEGQTLALALSKNAQLLKKSCSGVLRGEEWI